MKQDSSLKGAKMIMLSNGHRFEYMTASGALAYDGKGWPWEWPLVWSRIIRPELFTNVIKTLTLLPRKGNYKWWKPGECVRFISGGCVNKFGLTNPGIGWWCEKALQIDFRRLNIVGSIFGNRDELVCMARVFNQFNVVALEVNSSCPNSGDPLEVAEAVIGDVKAVQRVSHHPIIAKVSVAQDYIAIERGLRGVVEAISLNSVPWEIAFPGKRSPLWPLEKRVGGGGGGVSGIPAQKYNWAAVKALVEQGRTPVIGPSVMDFGDVARVRNLGASAISFGAILLRTPWRPTTIVRRDQQALVKSL